MTIKEFCESHGVQMQAVSMYIKRHPELFDGLTSQGQDRRSTELTDQAIAILEKKYPYPEPVAIYQYDPADRERIKELEEQIRQQALLLTQAQDMIARQQQYISDMGDAKTLLDSVQLQLEDKTERLTEEKKRADREMEKAAGERERADQATEKAHAADLAKMAAEHERDAAVMATEASTEALKKAEERADQAEAEIARLKNRSFLDRLFNR